jgi:chemotaxis signal transduction protein
MGLTNVRGEVVPVFDGPSLMGGEPLGEARYVVVVDTARGPAGVAVAAMPATREVTLEAEPLAPLDPDELVPGSGA